MNREEIEWITQNLFVGNKLWSGQVRSKAGQSFDLRDIRSPIVLFASMGDNITPPQQAFNWVADIYQSTEDIKSRGQVIVGLLHREVGHLGIFVSGRVAKKEHTQIVSVLKSIEALPPGLYGMQVRELNRGNGTQYEVEFREHRLEELVERLNRFKRADESPFMAVAELSEFNQRAYELFARLLVQATATELGARLSRWFHPLRFQRWAISDVNPWFTWLGPAAEWVKANRRALDLQAPSRQWERLGSELTSAGLDLYRELRDSASEALFYQNYGSLFSLYLADQREAEEHEEPVTAREMPVVQNALAAISSGGYAEAVARVFALLARQDVPFPLEQLHRRRELAEKFAPLLPKAPWEEQRRIRGQQDIIVRYEPTRALETLPLLLRKTADRVRLSTLLERLLADRRMANYKLTPHQLALLTQIRQVLAPKTLAPAAVSVRRRTSPKRSRKILSSAS